MGLLKDILDRIESELPAGATVGLLVLINGAPVGRLVGIEEVLVD